MAIIFSNVGSSQITKLHRLLVQLNVGATSAASFSDELWSHIMTLDPSIGFILTSTIRSAVAAYTDDEQIEIARRYCDSHHIAPQVMTAA